MVISWFLRAAKMLVEILRLLQIVHLGLGVGPLEDLLQIILAPWERGCLRADGIIFEDEIGVGRPGGPDGASVEPTAGVHVGPLSCSCPLR